MHKFKFSSLSCKYVSTEKAIEAATMNIGMVLLFEKIKFEKYKIEYKIKIYFKIEFAIMFEYSRGRIYQKFAIALQHVN